MTNKINKTKVYLIREDCGVEGYSGFIEVFSKKSLAKKLLKMDRNLVLNEIIIDSFDFVPLYWCRYIIKPIIEKCSGFDLKKIKKFPYLKISKCSSTCFSKEDKKLPKKPVDIGFGEYGSTGLGYCVYIKARSRKEARLKFFKLK